MNENINDMLSSLPKQQAIKLTEISKTRPQMESISSRNLIKNLPWVNVTGGHYRVNRRKVLEIRPGLVTFTTKTDKGKPTNIPIILGSSLSQMPSLSKIQDEDVLNLIAAAAKKVEIKKGDLVVKYDSKPTNLYIIYSGKVGFYKPGKFDENNEVGAMGPSQYFGGFGLHYDSSPAPLKDTGDDGKPAKPAPEKPLKGSIMQKR